MRPLFALLLFIAVVHCVDPESPTSTRRPRKPHRKASEDLSKYNGDKNNRTEKDFEYVRSKLARRRQRTAKKIALTEDQQRRLDEKIMKIGHPSYAKLEQGITEINDNDESLFEGDIVLTPNQVDEIEQEGNTEHSRRKRQAYKDASFPKTLWTSPIPYTLESSLTTHARTAITEALAFWEANTCISFKQNGAGQNSLRFFSGDGCYSYVGRIAEFRQQEISIGTGCDAFYITTHEIAHALGFFHEQSRHDRDNYVTINLRNVYRGMEGNFDKETTATNYNYQLPYEYGGVMQYGPYSFAINDRSPTMVPTEDEYFYTLGSGTGPTFYDLLMMNKHYSCLSACDSYNTVCQNGGFKNPRNCSTCICPSGYGGSDCSQRTPGCGETVTASATAAVLTGRAGDRRKTRNDNFDQCVYWITAPAGKAIEITLSNIGQVCSEGCVYGGVEIKAQADQLATGARYCCSESKGTVVVSASNRVPIIVFNRYYYSEFTISYRTVGAAVTTGSTTTTSRTTSCSDVASNCAPLAYLCENTVYKSLMTQQCPSTCGRCTATTATTTTTAAPAPSCNDVANDCGTLAYLCNNSLYYSIMTQQCPRTCSRC